MSKLLRMMTVFALLLSVFAGPGTALAGGDVPGPDTGPRFVPGELLIRFNPRVSERAKADARSRTGAVKERGLKVPGDLELASLPPGRSVADAVRALETHPAVAFAEPNWIYTQQVESNDPYYTGQINRPLWGMYGDDKPSPAGPTGTTNQYGSQAEKAWANDHTGSNSVYVGVIDEGVDYKHADLSTPGPDGTRGTCDDGGNSWRNPGECGLDAEERDKTTNGIDDDGNGYVDDYYGWDFLGNNKTCYDGNEDNQGEKHGTHVSGTIGGVGGNGTGVVGVNWNVTVICGKFLGGNGGTLADAVEAVNYFTTLKLDNDVNIVATNNSWGGGGYSQALHDAIIRGAKAGILFVAAAGNDGTNNDRKAHYPSNYDTSIGTSTEPAASYDAVIAVAAIASDGSKPRWSNYGAKTVDLGAPGVGIWSTFPSYLSDPYGNYSGTSMATPHVTGAAALYSSTHPTASAKEIKDAILNSAILTGSMDKKTVTGGRLDAGGF